MKSEKVNINIGGEAVVGEIKTYSDVAELLSDTIGSRDPAKAALGRLAATGLFDLCEKFLRSEAERGSECYPILLACIQAFGMIMGNAVYGMSKKGSTQKVAEFVAQRMEIAMLGTIANLDGKSFEEIMKELDKRQSELTRRQSSA